MADPRRFDIAIVGAGIAGSALACALIGNGLRIALIEAKPAAGQPLPDRGELVDYDARVSALNPQSQALLDGWGAWPDIAGYRLSPYTRMNVWDAQGTGQIVFDSAEVSAPALGHIVENRVVVEALQRRWRSAQEIAELVPQRLVACHRQPGGELLLELESGMSLTVNLLVAADGALSQVRELLGFATREWDYGHRAMVATVEVERDHQATAWQRFLPSGPLAFLPLAGTPGRHLCSIVWSLRESLVDELLALAEPEFCRRLEAAFEQRLGRVLASSPRLAFPLRQRHALSYIQPGVALVGDAAHTIHPLAGQGINLGLQDVRVLAEEVLAGGARGGNPGRIEVLRRYQRRRKGENLLMMTAMEGFKRLFEQESLPLRWLRNAGMRGVDRGGPLKQLLMRHAMGLNN